MRFTTIITFSVLLLTYADAKKSAKGTFDEYHQKALISSPVRLDDPSYETLTGAPRDYHVAVLLTALEARFGCQLCRDFQPEWDILGRSWLRGDKKGDSRLIFGTLDFQDGKGAFQKLMLQTAPVLLLFPPTTGPSAKANAQPLRYDFTTGSQTAELVRQWILRHLPEGPRPGIYRPLNYTRIITILTGLLASTSVMALAWPYALPVLQNRNLWAALSLITILLFTSGHMFNHIRKVPYVAGDGKGGINYFAGGFSNQFGLETQIVAAMYGTLSFATIALALKVPRMTDMKGQQLAVFLWGAVMFLMYSFLLNVFRVKNGGYPFYLPPF